MSTLSATSTPPITQATPPITQATPPITQATPTTDQYLAASAAFSAWAAELAAHAVALADAPDGAVVTGGRLGPRLAADLGEARSHLLAAADHCHDLAARCTQLATLPVP